jgi:gamma-glutamyl-gamma-aminobutyrate hydrolase PuuD
MNERELHKIVDYLQRTEQDLRTSQEAEMGSAKRTNRMIQSMFGIIGVIALLNLYFVANLAQEVRVVIRSMTKMYEQFGDMSGQMSAMRVHVGNMSENIAMMPIMVEQMGAISANMESMKGDVNAMRSHMVNMNGQVSSMNQDIGTMTVLFRDVTGKVVGMRQQVGQMSQVVP